MASEKTIPYSKKLDTSRLSWARHIHSTISHHLSYRLISFFATYIVIKLHNKNQRSVQFSKWIFNPLCLLHVSKLLRSFSGRQLYMQHDVFLHASVWAVWWIGDCVRACSVSNTLFYPPDCKTCRTAYTGVSLRMNPRGSKLLGDDRN